MLESNYSRIMHNIVQNSGYMDENHPLFKKAMASLERNSKRELVCGDEVFEDLEKQTFKKGVYNSWVINGNLKSTKSRQDLFTKDEKHVVEQVIQCEPDFSLTDVKHVQETNALATVMFAKQFQHVYFDMIKGGASKLTDFLPDNVKRYSKGLNSFEFLISPSVGMFDEIPVVDYHRECVNRVIESVIEEGDKILFIGGDGGSASKRRRKSYQIDASYFTDIKYSNACDTRMSMGVDGKDYHIPIDKYRTTELSFYKQYKIIFLNYIGDEELFDALSERLMDTDILVCGFHLDPDVGLLKDDVKFFDSYESLNDYAKSYDMRKIRDRYKILGLTKQHVAVFCDHSVWLDRLPPRGRNDYMVINKELLGYKMGVKRKAVNSKHSTFRVLKNKNPFQYMMSFSTSFLTPESYRNTVVEYVVKSHKLYDKEDVLLLGYIGLDDCHLQGYYDEKDDMFKFIDCDLPYNFWNRRVEMQKFLRLDYGDGLMLSSDHQYGDDPLMLIEKKVSFEEAAKTMGLVRNEKGNFLLPKFAIKGMFFNPITREWYKDPDRIIYYMPYTYSGVRDSGVPFRIQLSSRIAMDVQDNSPCLGEEFDGLRIIDGLELYKVKGKAHKIRESHVVKLYGVDFYMFPDGVFCGNYKEIERGDITVYDGGGHMVDGRYELCELDGKHLRDG
jgi:hypothetical protein